MAASPPKHTTERTPLVLLACGSFNPITYSHLRLFELARDYYRLKGNYEVVEGILSPVGDAYKKPGLIPFAHRLPMTKLAIEAADWLTIDTWEAEQPEYMTTIKVIKQVEERVNARRLAAGLPPAALRLLCGADLLQSFTKPGVWAEEDMHAILGDYGVTCITRQGTDLDSIIYSHDILWQHTHDIDIITNYIPNEVSSTRIRQCLQRGLSVKYLIPDNVVAYIKEHHLYK